MFYGPDAIPVNPSFSPETASSVRKALSDKYKTLGLNRPYPTNLPRLPPEVLSSITDYLAVHIGHGISPRLFYAMSQVYLLGDHLLGGDPAAYQAKAAMRRILEDPARWRQLLNDVQDNAVAADARLALLREEVLVATVRQAFNFFGKDVTPDWSKMTHYEAGAVEVLIKSSEGAYERMRQQLATELSREGYRGTEAVHYAFRNLLKILNSAPMRRLCEDAASAIRVAREDGREGFMASDPRYFSSRNPHIVRIEPPRKAGPPRQPSQTVPYRAVGR